MRLSAARLILVTLAVLGMLSGCSQDSARLPDEPGAFVDKLQASGVDGSLYLRAPFNEDMEYVAEYTIARYASTRVITLFRFKDAARAASGLQEVLQNDKLSGQAVNGKFVMAATFYPPDPEAVEKIRTLFLAHRFE
jgi:hypothetical protein